MVAWNNETENIVRKFARSWCRRCKIYGEDVTDVEQDAVIHAWRKVTSGKVEYKQALWFLVRNLVYDFCREVMQKPFHSNYIELSEIVDICPIDLIGVYDDPLIELIAEKMPDHYTRSMARAEGYDWDMIAEALGEENTGTLRVRHSRDCERARKLLEEAS